MKLSLLKLCFIHTQQYHVMLINIHRSDINGTKNGFQKRLFSNQFYMMVQPLFSSTGCALPCLPDSFGLYVNSAVSRPYCFTYTKITKLSCHKHFNRIGPKSHLHFHSHQLYLLIKLSYKKKKKRYC